MKNIIKNKIANSRYLRKGTIFGNKYWKIKNALLLKGIFFETTYVCILTCEI